MKGAEMSSIRAISKFVLPESVREVLRDHLLPPPEEDVVLHGYSMTFDKSAAARLNLVIPTVATRRAFGGVLTAVEFTLQLAKRTGSDLRIIVDDREPVSDSNIVDRRAAEVGLDSNRIEIVQRTEFTPNIALRSSDMFISFNWWITMNLLPVLRAQAEHFGQPPVPFLYLIQEYEPQFYPFSTTHMLARSAFNPPWPCWGIFNSHELHEYFALQGHRLQRDFVFEPRLSNSLRSFLSDGQTRRLKRILVYGRAGIPRNCFPAVKKGLSLWAKRYPQQRDWEVLSVGLPHRPIPLGDGRKMRSIGKLSLESYADMLRETAIGLSLMASPHPSYPPLEMAYFGMLTITNSYANKNLSADHDNITSLSDIRPETIAEAIAEACTKFERDPDIGGSGKGYRKSFLQPGSFDCIDELACALLEGPWCMSA